MKKSLLGSIATMFTSAKPRRSSKRQPRAAIGLPENLEMRALLSAVMEIGAGANVPAEASAAEESSTGKGKSLTSIDPNGSITTATLLGTVNVSNTYSKNNSVTWGSDTNDYYKVILSRRNHMVVSLTGLTGDADLQILDANRNVLSFSVNSSTTPDKCSAVLTSGTYYIRVYKPASGVASYKMTVAVGDQAKTSAINFGTNAQSVSFNGDIGAGDSQDWYRFDITTRRGIGIYLTGLSADADIDVYTAAGTRIGSSHKTGIQNETIQLNLNAGTYYVRVIPYLNVRTNYTIRNTATVGTWGSEIGRV